MSRADDQQDHPTDEEHPGGPAADPESDLFDDEGDIDKDRQDPPTTDNADEDGAGADGLDGFESTPGDGEDDR